MVPVTSQIHRRHIPEETCVSYIIRGQLTPLNDMCTIVVNVLTVSQMCPRHIPDNLAFIKTCSRFVNSHSNNSLIHHDCRLPDADMSPNLSPICPRPHQDSLICIFFVLFHPPLCWLQKSCDVLDVLAMSLAKVVACPACVTPA